MFLEDWWMQFIIRISILRPPSWDLGVLLQGVVAEINLQFKAKHPYQQHLARARFHTTQNFPATDLHPSHLDD